MLRLLSVVRVCFCGWSLRAEFIECNEFRRQKKVVGCIPVQWLWLYYPSHLRYCRIKFLLYHIFHKSFFHRYPRTQGSFQTDLTDTGFHAHWSISFLVFSLLVNTSFLVLSVPRSLLLVFVLVSLSLYCIFYHISYHILICCTYQLIYILIQNSIKVRYCWLFIHLFVFKNLSVINSLFTINDLMLVQYVRNARKWSLIMIIFFLTFRICFICFFVINSKI